MSPNPATSEVEITYAQTQQDYPVKVYNPFNKVVATGTLRKGKLRLNTHRLPVGIYIITVVDEKNGLITARMVKN